MLIRTEMWESKRLGIYRNTHKFKAIDNVTIVSVSR